jgi:hypothetical protein
VGNELASIIRFRVAARSISNGALGLIFDTAAQAHAAYRRQLIVSDYFSGVRRSQLARFPGPFSALSRQLAASDDPKYFLAPIRSQLRRRFLVLSHVGSAMAVSAEGL